MFSTVVRLAVDRAGQPFSFSYALPFLEYLILE